MPPPRHLDPRAPPAAPHCRSQISAFPLSGRSRVSPAARARVRLRTYELYAGWSHLASPHASSDLARLRQTARAAV
ncbi:hypothetical protein NDU88_006263 [Pleurodeles waltl]|uniref:Uncharacterized protein n=1 Tax=Pleurodeles waltl TaxID=8319 RepID=A0AAV7UP43_PLEWA|nr:hypothetical protein NDU88_006263 [Pleurodeles waltl]